MSGRPCPLKVRYINKREARHYLESALSRGSGEIRYYLCPTCRGYHLTSQEGPTHDHN